MIDPVLVGVTTAVLVTAVAIAIHRHTVKDAEDRLRLQMEATNRAERNTHQKEMEYLEERNRREIAHAETLSKARSAAFEDGKKQARSEHELEVSMRLSEQKSEFLARLQSERMEAATEACDRLRAEYALQTKLFSVKISPYVQLLTDKGMFKDTYEARLGYQYQLLVNGIPAFKPHEIIERHEKIDQVDQQIKDRLLSIAQTCAEAAVTTYLGASPQFAKLSPGVFDQVAKREV